MKSALALAALIAAACAAPLNAVPGGELGTLTTGIYRCELPGSAAGPAGIHVPEEDFTVVSASSYIANGKRGIYLLTGDVAVVTSGPFKGKRYHRISRGFLRLVDAEGKDAPLRCVRVARSAS